MNEYNKKIIDQTLSFIKSNEAFPKNFIENHKNIFCIVTFNNEIKIIEALIEKMKKEYDENVLDKYINYLSDDGATPLHYSIYNGNKEIVNLLCENGAIPYQRPYDGESALELAKRKLSDYTEIVNKLESINKKDNIYIKKGKIGNNVGKSQGAKMIENDDDDIFKSIKPKGLNNIDGSCYLNSVLQCLFHVKPLSLYILNEEKNLYDKPFTKSYFTVVSGLAQKYKSYKSFSPSSFKIELEKNNPNYGADPKDVILDFFYYVNKELLCDENSIQLDNTINKCNKNELFQYYKGEFERAKTKISELFGWFKQIIRECNCNKITYDFVLEYHFIFNLKKVCLNTKKKYYLNLLECFKDYFKEEKKIFTCQNCGKRKMGKICQKICVLPKFLLIILDRGKDDKFKCQVDFDYNLDLNEITEQIENEKYKAKYELIGATFLIGSSGGGHTIAYCKHFDGKYYLFNDNRYEEKLLNELKYYKAFLLFYERKNDNKIYK